MTKQQRVYESLREEILSAALAPGQRLFLNRLADRFEMSPIPVREALRLLEHEGLVDVLPHVRVIVAELPIEEALWAQEVRLALEPVAARDAVPHVSPYHVELMRHELDIMADNLETSGGNDFATSYNAFHDLLYANTPNRRLVSIIERQRATARRFRAVTGKRHSLVNSLADLNLVVAAIEARNASEVYSRVRAHREQALELLLEWAAQQEPREAVA